MKYHLLCQAGQLALLLLLFFGSLSQHSVSSTLLFAEDFKESRTLIEDTSESFHSSEFIAEASTNSQKRTATGGVVRQVLVLLSMIAFLGNGAFMVFVFWM